MLHPSQRKYNVVFCQLFIFRVHISYIDKRNVFRYSTYMTPLELTIPKPDDWHVHLRQDKKMPGYARAHRNFGRILAMPNTIPPLVTPKDILEYRKTAENACPGLTVQTAFRLMPDMSSKDIDGLAEAGIPAGKYYPDGATTNSQNGISHWHQIRDALAAMEKNGLILCIHGEEPDAPVLERERAFLPAFLEIRRTFPGLKMILEHVSTADGVRLVKVDDGPTAATVTPQHLMFTLDDLLGGLLNPHLFCKPVLKLQADREAIEEAVLSGDRRFFFGSDSAPHAEELKHSDSCPAGVYSAPILLPLLAQYFDRKGKLDMMKPFLCDFGREFYGAEPNPGTVKLVKNQWTVPNVSEGCVPLMAGQTLDWQVV